VLLAGPGDRTEVAATAHCAAEAGIAVEAPDAAGLAERLPLLRFAAGTKGLFEARDAGTISPRRPVLAQTIAAQRAGAWLVAEPALDR